MREISLAIFLLLLKMFDDTLNVNSTSTLMLAKVNTGLHLCFYLLPLLPIALFSWILQIKKRKILRS